MKPTKEMLKEYEAIAKKSNRNMKDCIKAHLVANCPKFAGHEDKFDECIEYVTECAKEILDGKNGEVADDACYKMARDFFNDELWEKDDEANASKEAKRKADKEPAKKTASQVEKESLGKERQRIEKLKEKQGCKPAEPEKTCKADEEAKKAELEKMQAEALKKAEEKKINDKIHAKIAEKNKELGIGMAQPIDMFAEAV